MPDFGIPAILSLLRAMGGLLGKMRSFLAGRSHIFQPALSGGRTHAFFPRDFFAKIKLGSTRTKILAMLGEPDHAFGERWTYTYKEVHLQLAFYPEEGSLQAIILGFVGNFGRDSIEIPWLDKKLGDLTLLDAMGYCQFGPNELQLDVGGRWHGVKLEERCGPRGAEQFMSFGALLPDIGQLTFPPDFEWDFVTKKLKTPPDYVLINWVALSSTSFEQNWFDWTAGIPSH